MKIFVSDAECDVYYNNVSIISLDTNFTNIVISCLGLQIAILKQYLLFKSNHPPIVQEYDILSA